MNSTFPETRLFPSETGRLIGERAVLITELI